MDRHTSRVAGDTLTSNAPMEFRAVVEEFLAGHFALDPVRATDAGNHDHDGEWPDLTDAGRRARSAFLRDAERRLMELPVGGLSRDDAIDRELLLEQVRADLFEQDRLAELGWNPLAYVYLAGSGLFGLLAREFAPLDVRLRSMASRLRGLPSLLDAARQRLDEPGGRAVSRFHTEKAISDMPGAADLATAAREAANTLDDAALREEVGDAATVGRAAADAFTSWLRDDLLPRAEGGFRLGRALHEEKLRHALRTDLRPAEIMARAEVAHAGVRQEMVELATSLWDEWVPGEERPSDGGAVVRRVLDAIAADHPAAGELLDFCRAELGRIEAFVRERDVIGLMEDPLEIIWTPAFLRAGAGAMLIPPGPLDRGLKSYFCITPMPEHWTAEQVESNLREDNARMLRLLTIHEAVPGHYLQLAYANRSESLVRSVFMSGVFVEGWAVYVTQVMMDLGYGADDRALMLVHWKYFLRAITNAIIDIGIHSGEMDEAEAMRLMVDEGYQERSEASEKWSRARLTSTQLCEYFVGSLEMTDLEREARRRASADGRPFVYRDHLEGVIAHGSPPPRTLRRILSSAV